MKLPHCRQQGTNLVQVLLGVGHHGRSTQRSGSFSPRVLFTHDALAYQHPTAPQSAHEKEHNQPQGQEFGLTAHGVRSR